MENSASGDTLAVNRGYMSDRYIMGYGCDKAGFDPGYRPVLEIMNAAQLTADIAAWQTRFAGSVTLWVSYPDALCTAATDALGTTGTSLGMENLLVTSSTELDADSRAALEQAAADAGVQHVVVHDAAAFR